MSPIARLRAQRSSGRPRRRMSVVSMLAKAATDSQPANAPNDRRTAEAVGVSGRRSARAVAVVAAVAEPMMRATLTSSSRRNC